MTATAKCKRCRFKWNELLDTKHTNGIGQLRFCPKCLCDKIRRWYSKTPKPDLYPVNQ